MSTITSVIPTGTPFDEASGIGGLSGGRVTEIFGPIAAGHVTLALRAVAAAQKQGRVCAIIDCDHYLLPIQAADEGIDLAEVLASEPGNRAQAFEIIDTLARTGAVDLIVVLGIGDLSERDESRLVRHLLERIARTTTAVVFVEDRGHDGAEHRSSALRFYASVRVKVQRVRSTAHVKFVKNKLAAPFSEAFIELDGAPAPKAWCPELD